ncbi:hypothetical protein LBMAG53_16480 [Planctomycetota bacterium]|nr:hypothetical protein LBMAG53_16480 [Planctomycetota bacterium]
MTAALPQTRSLRRPGSAGSGWLVGAMLAILVNGAVILVLGGISRLPRMPSSPAPLAMELRTVEPPKPEPPPESPPEPSAEPTASETPPPPALPALEFASSPSPDATPLALPVSLSLDLPATLPLTIPSFTAAIPATAPSAAPAVELGPPDQPAMRRGELNLEGFYPRAARLRSVTGTSRIRLAIAADGNVTSVALVDSQPPGVFDRAAQQLGQSLRFDPARRAGAAVASEQILTIDWRIR